MGGVGGGVLFQRIGFADALMVEGVTFGVEGEGELGEEVGLCEGFGGVALAKGDFKVVAGLKEIGQTDGGHVVQEGEGFG